MSFDGALVTEQGVTFAIVCVKPHVLRSTDKEDVREQFSSFFGFVPSSPALLKQSYDNVRFRRQ
jgi:hypothetical protein